MLLTTCSNIKEMANSNRLFFASVVKGFCKRRLSSKHHGKKNIIVIGGGHNALVAAAYLGKSLDRNVIVLERRHCFGGAAVTEEIVKGFKFSRASYLAGLLRPAIIKELDLEKFGFKYLSRDPSSFTPTLQKSKYQGKYLLLGSDENKNWESIAQFSARDADAFVEYEAFLGRVRELVQPIIDCNPPVFREGASMRENMKTLLDITNLIKVGYKNREILIPFYQLMTSPASHLLDRWFESDILKATLATDAVIGAMISPKQAGSAYVLLHHVMGEADGRKGVWAYVEGGMGSISNALAASAKATGRVHIRTDCDVKSILTDTNATTDKNSSGGAASVKAVGVVLESGEKLYADIIISGISPYHTFTELVDGSVLPQDFLTHIKATDLSCGSFKINCAINALPNFTCYPSPIDPQSGKPIAGPMHRGTVHFESTMEEIDAAYRDAVVGRPATRPVIELTLPSALDPTLAPPGMHIAQLFVQFAPYDLADNMSWADASFKDDFVRRCIGIVDEFAPGFARSVRAVDALSPLDLEKIFRLPKGNIFHGSLGLHQLAYMRPAPGYSSYRSPINGTHPGGGVMGAPGRNCAMAVLTDNGI